MNGDVEGWLIDKEAILPGDLRVCAESALEE